MTKESEKRDSTLAALLKEKPKRGRPKHAVSRQNVYIELSKEHKQLITNIANQLPKSISRADVADLAVVALSSRFEAMRRAVSGRSVEIPEGVTDMESLYLLWDLPLPQYTHPTKWTSIRLSPQQVIELGRVNGTLNAVYGATRSETFILALTILHNFVESRNLFENDLVSLYIKIKQSFLS